MLDQRDVSPNCCCLPRVAEIAVHPACESLQPLKRLSEIRLLAFAEPTRHDVAQPPLPANSVASAATMASRSGMFRPRSTRSAKPSGLMRYSCLQVSSS